MRSKPSVTPETTATPKPTPTPTPETTSTSTSTYTPETTPTAKPLQTEPTEAMRNAVTLAPMTQDQLDAVMAIEQTAYSHPWTRGNFRDSINPLFEAQCLWYGDELLGYFLAMRGFEEMHLLNITVAPARQGQGWGHMMLDALSLLSRHEGAQWLWLEVRQSNLRALKVYERYGFRQISIRKDYYPSDRQRREHAVVMSLKL